MGGTREVITVPAGRGCLRGTCHKPQGQTSESVPDQERGKTIGILFLSWVLPRAGNGDSAVYWAEFMAKCGYLAFRFDLPGLGDSDGDLSTPGIDVEAGAFGPALSSIVDHLVDCFHLKAVVVVGNCAGAVTAVYAATANEHIKGLILLDPYFHVQQSGEVQTLLNNWNKRFFKTFGAGWAVQSKLRAAAVQLLSGLRNIYHGLSRNRLFVRRKRLPSAANLQLIHCWIDLTSAGIPILVLTSSSYAPKAGGFDYIDYLQRRSPRGSRMSLEPVEGASHAFAERQSREAVGKCTERWLQACFPIPKCTGAQDSEPQAAELANAILGTDRNVR